MSDRFTGQTISLDEHYRIVRELEVKLRDMLFNYEMQLREAHEFASKALPPNCADLPSIKEVSGLFRLSREADQASTAQYSLQEYKAAIREIEHLYNTDRVPHQTARRLEKLFDRYLYGDDEVSPPDARYFDEAHRTNGTNGTTE